MVHERAIVEDEAGPNEGNLGLQAANHVKPASHRKAGPEPERSGEPQLLDLGGVQGPADLARLEHSPLDRDARRQAEIQAK